MFKRTGLFWLWLSVLVLILDQWTKYLVSGHLEMYVPYKITEFFNLTLMHNTGMAFSLLADQSGWQRYFLGIVAALITVWLVYWLHSNKRKQKLQNLALVLVIGGALGNLWDRVALGYVVDFIEVHYKSYYWPAFNVADAAISIGFVLLIIDAIKNRHENTAGQS